MTAWTFYISFVVLFLGFCAFTWKKPGWGLGLMPFVIFGMTIMAAIKYDDRIFEEHLFLFIFPFLLFPVTISIVHWAPSASSLETPWYKSFAGVVITIFLYLILLAGLTLVFRVYGPIFFVLFVVAIVRFKQTHKYTLAMEIVSAIGMSMRQSLPLPMALNTAAHGQKRKAAKIFTDIAHWLSEGQPLSESLRRGYRKCPSELLASITAAEKMNQLPKAIGTLQLDIAEKLNDYKKVRPVHPWYPVIVLIIASFFVMGLMYFIVPIFAEVISDMSDGTMGFPVLTQTLLNLSNWLKGRHGLNFLFILLPFLCILLLWVHARFRRRNPDQPRLLSRIGDFLKWHLPIVHWFEENYSHLQLTEMLKVGLRAGYPVNTTIRNTLNLDMNLCYRNRIRQWLEKVERGENIAQSALKSGIGRTLAWALDDTVNKGNAPVILETLEEVYRSRYNYRLNILHAIICPLMVIGLGCCVGFVVTAMFLPMVKMIEIMLW